jgi:hypothetical protein
MSPVPGSQTPAANNPVPERNYAARKEAEGNGGGRRVGKKSATALSAIWQREKSPVDRQPATVDFHERMRRQSVHHR